MPLSKDEINQIADAVVEKLRDDNSGIIQSAMYTAVLEHAHGQMEGLQSDQNIPNAKKFDVRDN